MGSLIIPGDELHINKDSSVIQGPGVYCEPKSQRFIPVNAGIEMITDSKKGQTVYVDFNSRRYVPALGDLVVGTISGSFSDSYRVSLANFSTPVTLSYMAFPNASKKNRPTLKVGDLVYARVSNAEKELEAEIECLDSTTGKDVGYGLLDGGFVVDISLAYARELLFNDEFPLLHIMAKYTQFEVAIGVNGKVWIKCDDAKSTLACYRSILECQSRPVGEYKRIIAANFKEITNAME